jgi:Holliday junction resolvase RusA-like endonuclease
VLATELTDEHVKEIRLKAERYKRAVEQPGDTVYNITPMPKPRQTQCDKWKQRPVVMAYRAFKDHVALEKLKFDECYSHIVFIMPMPASWSNSKKERMLHTPHKQQNADIDNLCKAMMDAVYKQDGSIWDIRISKIWGYEGAIVVSRKTWRDKPGIALALVSQALRKGKEWTDY